LKLPVSIKDGELENTGEGGMDGDWGVNSANITPASLQAAQAGIGKI